MIKGNLYDGLPLDNTREHFDDLLVSGEIKLERIVSRGHATPPGLWLDQDRAEWVVLLKGVAGLLIEGEPTVQVLRPGDYIYIPAHTRHRVEWTQTDGETIWLALLHMS